MKSNDGDGDRVARSADQLEALRRKWKKTKKGYRRTKYEIIAETMRTVVRMRSDINQLTEFVERNDLDVKKLNKKDNSWIASTAFTFVNQNEQQGWKDARIAEFLYDVKKVPVGKLADQILKLGGIAKLVKLAAKEDPRRSKEPGKKRAKPAAKKGSFGSGSNDNADAPTPDNDFVPKGGETEIAARISPALRAKIKAIKPDRRVKLICVREGKTAVRIVKVTALKPHPDAGDAAWK